MLTARRKKEIISLKQKKYRQRYRQFVVEGEKSVLELCQSNWLISEIIMTPTIFERIGNQIKNHNILIISQQELEQLSNLETSPGIMAVSNFKEISLNQLQFTDKFTLVLDSISDPGNLGTIIRIADWYGIENIICSEDCVDLYNPKSISATMGSFIRINVCYTSLESFLNNFKIPSYACVMNGDNLDEVVRKKPHEGLIVIGNEAKGIDASLIELCSNKITIPRYGNAESLNAGVAAAIVVHSFISNSK